MGRNLHFLCLIREELQAYHHKNPSAVQGVVKLSGNRGTTGASVKIITVSKLRTAMSLVDLSQIQIMEHL